MPRLTRSSLTSRKIITVPICVLDYAERDSGDAGNSLSCPKTSEYDWSDGLCMNVFT